MNTNKKKGNKSSTNICYAIHDEVRRLLPILMIGKTLTQEDFISKSVNYDNFVQQFACFLKYESEFYADVIDEQLAADPQGYKEIFLSKCLNLVQLQDNLNDFNVKLKKVQQISNRKWQQEVKPMLKPIVMLCYIYIYYYYYHHYIT